MELFEDCLADVHHSTSIFYGLCSPPKYEEALTEAKHALEIKRRLMESRPLVPEYKFNYCNTYQNVAKLYMHLEEVQSSLKAHDECLRLIAELRLQYPGHGYLRVVERNIYWVRAYAQEKAGFVERAQEDFDKALALNQPEDGLPLIVLEYSALMQKYGQSQKAALSIEPVRYLTEWTASNRHHFARIFVLASKAVPERRAEFEQASIEELKRTLELDEAKAKEFDYSDFGSVTDRADFPKALR